MKIRIEDTVMLADDPRTIGVVVGRSGDLLTIRVPDNGNSRRKIHRSDVRALAEAMCEARERKTKFRNDLSLTGDSTLAELVAAFGYSTSQLRQASLDKVCSQLSRAGLVVKCVSDTWGRDERFSLTVQSTVQAEAESSETEADDNAPTVVHAELPDPFWPTALGLDPNREMAFLRSLGSHEPLLCILHVPNDPVAQTWLQPTWEGLVGRAFRGAQCFSKLPHVGGDPEVLIGAPAMLPAYLKMSALAAESPRLLDGSHSLNLVSLKSDAEFPVDFDRLQAAWPGAVYQFRPEGLHAIGDHESADVTALLQCLLLASGVASAPQPGLSPLKVMLWGRNAARQILAHGSGLLGTLLSTGKYSKFKGSNETATALALKAHLAGWIGKAYASSSMEFEASQIEKLDPYGETVPATRIDLAVDGVGRFEVESMIGSGPFEAFYHRKVFARLGKKESPFWLVVPSEAVLWAGPYLADLAHHLNRSGQGHVAIPGVDDAYIELQGHPLAEREVDLDPPWGDMSLTSASGPVDGKDGASVVALRMDDVAGYSEIRQHVDDLIIWPEKHRRASRGPSRSSGILFFGPPGCGKSRLAQAIAGELDQEVRLLGPSDLRGAYMGWGQVLVREQFDWVAEHERRMLVIDELDAVARSRRNVGNMHEDEMANVNELLVQLDRVSRLGRLIVGTTNYVDSLDDAVVRSGRFGRFVPVPPPDIDESIAILQYYLKRLANDDGRENHPRVEIPDSVTLRSVLEVVRSENLQELRCFCGADLEEAVNRTYQRCLRLAIGDSWPSDDRSITVNLTRDELLRSMRQVRHSVTEEALDQFIQDADRYCGGDVASRLSQRFRSSK